MQNSLNTFDVHFVYKMFFEIVVYSTRICKFKFIFLQLITGIKNRDSSNLYHIKLLLVYIHINKYKDLQTLYFIFGGLLATLAMRLQFCLLRTMEAQARATESDPARERERGALHCLLVVLLLPAVSVSAKKILLLV